MKDVEILSRISRTLKKDIGPAVEGDYPKTQAFMASVVLEKLAGQLGSAAAHAASNQQGAKELAKVLTQMSLTLSAHNDSDGDPRNNLGSAIKSFESQHNEQALCVLIEKLYQAKEDLGEDVFLEFLTPVRQYMRAVIDRRMEYSK